MKRIIVIYEAFDIVVVPFPFSDSTTTKRRPALVVSSYSNFNQKIEHSVMVMITSARNIAWPMDIHIKDLKPTGLPKASIIRMKFFTLDHRLIIKKIGKLSAKDQAAMSKVFQKLFQDFCSL